MGSFVTPPTRRLSAVLAHRQRPLVQVETSLASLHLIILAQFSYLYYSSNALRDTDTARVDHYVCLVQACVKGLYLYLYLPLEVSISSLSSLLLYLLTCILGCSSSKCRLYRLRRQHEAAISPHHGETLSGLMDPIIADKDLAPI